MFFSVSRATSQLLQLEATPHPKMCKTQGKCDRWTYRMDWLEALNVTVDIIEAVDPSKYFGFFKCCSFGIFSFLEGKERPNTREGFVDLPYMFIDKQIMAVSVENMYLRSMGVLPFTCCEVYAPLGINTNVWFSSRLH
jgi:hypothetical protein